MATVMKKNLFLLILLMTQGIALLAQNNNTDTPIVVRYGIYIKQFVPNFKEAKFHAEFYWWATFQNDTARAGNPSNDEIMNFEYVNGIDYTSEAFKAEIQEVRHLPNNVHYYTGFHQGEFYFNPDYSMYPMDVQTLEIRIENSLMAKNKLYFQVDSSSFLLSKQDPKLWGISADVLAQKNSVYNIFNSKIHSEEGIYNTNFGDPEFDPVTVYSRVTTSILINRSFAPYIAKLIIPLMIILLLVYLVFFLPAEKIDIAAGLTVTSLLSAIAFQLSLSGEIPEIGYIIYIDKIFYTCYFLIAISLVQSIITFYLDKSGEPIKVKQAQKIDVLFRFLFPIMFFLSLFLFAK